jgi:hypothetical protein
MAWQKFEEVTDTVFLTHSVHFGLFFQSISEIRTFQRKEISLSRMAGSCMFVMQIYKVPPLFFTF